MTLHQGIALIVVMILLASIIWIAFVNRIRYF